MKLKAIDISVFITLIVCIIATISFENDCKGIREEFLRLHVIANSDEDYDQELKLKVRDAILQSGTKAFTGSEDIISAESKITEQKESLRYTAEETARSLGFDYDIKIEVARSYFPTRTYDNLTLPAGYYKAVRVIIGEGKGKNWWCIMFPPLCLSAVSNTAEIAEDFLTKDEMAIVTSDPRYEIRFWLVEKYYEAKEKFSQL